MRSVAVIAGMQAVTSSEFFAEFGSGMGITGLWIANCTSSVDHVSVEGVSFRVIFFVGNKPVLAPSLGVHSSEIINPFENFSGGQFAEGQQIKCAEVFGFQIRCKCFDPPDVRVPDPGRPVLHERRA